MALKKEGTGVYYPNDSVTYFRRAGLPWIELCHIERRSRAWSSFCAGFELIVPVTLAVKILYRRREYALTPGQIFCAGPGEAYRALEILRPGSLKVVAIEPDVALECLARHGSARELGLRTLAPLLPAAAARLARLCRALEAPEPLIEHLPSAVSATLASMTVPLCSGEALPDGSVSLDTFHDPLSSLASDAVRFQAESAPPGFSRFQALRRFKRRYGLSPRTYNLCVRIALAKRSLRAGHSLASVAAAQEFTDQSHFTRHFKRLVGMTPRAYALVGRDRGECCSQPRPSQTPGP